MVRDVVHPVYLGLHVITYKISVDFANVFTNVNAVQYCLQYVASSGGFRTVQL